MLTKTALIILERMRGVKQKKRELQLQQSELDKEFTQLSNDLEDTLDEMFGELETKKNE